MESQVWLYYFQQYHSMKIRCPQCNHVFLPFQDDIFLDGRTCDDQYVWVEIPVLKSTRSQLRYSPEYAAIHHYQEQDCRKEKLFWQCFFTLCCSALFFYIWIFDRPDLPLFGVTLPLYGFWIITMTMDMRITLSIKRLIILHESNIIFRNLFAR